MSTWSRKGSGKDDEGHGTHVSGIIAARGNNAVGISGLCWSAKVMAVKFMDSKGRGSTSDAVTAIDYAIHEEAKIINGSFGSSAKSRSLEDEVDYAQDKGVLLVIAAGNSGESIDTDPSYPASYTNSNIISVAADLSYGKLRSAIRDHVTANPALAGKTVTGGQLDVAAGLGSVD